MFNVWMKSQLFDEAGGEGGAGGGAGGSGDGKFDPAAFKADLMGEFTKMLNGGIKALKSDIGKLIKPAGGAGGEGGGEGGEGGGEGGGDGAKAKDPHTKAIERQLKTLQDQLATEKTARESAEGKRQNAERDSRAQRMLNGFTFIDEEAGNDAFELIAPKLKWNEDGSALLGPDGETPAEEYVKTVMQKKSHLLAPKDVAGAGARKGGTAANRRFSIDDIDNMQKLSAEDQQKLRAQVAADMAGAMAGR